MGLRRYLTAGWMAPRDVLVREEPQPLEGTRMDLFNSIIPAWHADTYGTSLVGNAGLADRVWAANRAQHMNSAQIAAMPLEWHGPPGVDEPAWVSNPDPGQFPNGVGDVMYAIVDQLYGWGYSLQYITDYYSSGLPRRWTVIPSASCVPFFDDTGRRVYKLGGETLDPLRVVQIDRNPTTAAHGTSALAAYAQRSYSLLAAGNKSLSVSQDAFPTGYLKAKRRLMSGQADEARDKWMEKRTAANGAPPVLDDDWDFVTTQIDPADLALLDTQEWDARVIATAYGVPALLLNMALTGSLAYQTPLQLMQAWWLTELRTTAKRIVDAFTAQMLPRGQWVSVDASDITLELNERSDEDDPQLSQVAQASPAQRPLAAIGGGA